MTNIYIIEEAIPILEDNIKKNIALLIRCVFDCVWTKNNFCNSGMKCQNSSNHFLMFENVFSL